MSTFLDIRLLTVVAVVGSAAVLVWLWLPRYRLPVMIALGVIACRPSVIGERIPGLGPAIVIGAALICLVVGLVTRTRNQTANFLPFIVFTAAWLWLGVHRAIVPGAEPDLVSSTFTVFAPVIAFLFIARDRDLLLRTRNVLVVIVVITSVQAVCSVIAFVLVGPSAVSLGVAPLGYTGSGLGVYFPGAFSYGIDSSGELPRLLGLGREPGMGALFMGWAFFAMPQNFWRRNVWRAVLIGALLATQSTAGIGIFAACFILSVLIGRRRFSFRIAAVATVIGLAVIYVAVFSPAFGLVAKADGVGGNFSYSTRIAATLAGLESLGTEPFTATSDAPLSSVNLIAGIAVSAAPWFILTVAFLVLPVVRGGRRQMTTYGSLFVLLTMLTSQPLAGSTGVLLLTLVSFYSIPPAAPRQLVEAGRTDGETPGPHRTTL